MSFFRKKKDNAHDLPDEKKDEMKKNGIVKPDFDKSKKIKDNEIKNDGKDKGYVPPRYQFSADEKLDIAKFFAPVIVAFFLLLISFMAKKIILGPDAQKLAEQSSQITQIKTDIDLMNNQYKDMIAQETNFEEYAYYTGDTSKDDEIAANFFSHICTWSDSSMYETLRQEMFKLGYTSESTVMTSLLPEPVTYYDDESGNMIYAIDLNMDNMRFESLKSYPISSDAGKNEYSGILVVSSVDKSDEGMNQEHFGYVYVNYTIENDECKNVSAETLIKQ